MVMVKPATVKKPSVESSFFNKNWWKIGIGLMVLTVFVYFGYNKYLDRQNVAEMRQLLEDFEKLKTDVEAETGEKLYIEATCGSVGKFATSYACSLNIKPVNNNSTELTRNAFKEKDSNVRAMYGCGLYSETGYQVKDLAKDFYGCAALHVRGSNKSEAERIFYNYDTSPGSAI